MRWFLIDQLIECVPGKSALGVKSFTRSEVFFMDHFAGFPTVPGVLQIEMMATTGGKAIKLFDESLLPVLGSVKNAKFYHRIVPGDQCLIYSDIVKLRKAYAVCEARIEVKGKKMSEAEVMYGITSANVIDPFYVDPVLEDYRLNQGLPLKRDQLFRERRGDCTV